MKESAVETQDDMRWDRISYGTLFYDSGDTGLSRTPFAKKVCSAKRRGKPQRTCGRTRMKFFPEGEGLDYGELDGKKGFG